MKNLTERLLAGEAVTRQFELDGITVGLVLQILNGRFAATGDFQLPTSLAKATNEKSYDPFTLRSSNLVLEGCLFGNGSYEVSPMSGATSFKGDILPHMVWAGSMGLQDFAGPTLISATDTRLGVLFDLPHIEFVDALHSEHKAFKASFPQGEQFWYSKPGSKFHAKAHKGDVSIDLRRQLSTSSGQSGFSRSEVNHSFAVSSKSNQPLETMLNVVGDVEDVISVLAGAAFRFQHIDVFDPKIRKSSDLVWYANRAREDFETPSWHTLHAPNLSPRKFKALANFIFSLEEQERVALFQLIASMRAEDAQERFIAMAQSFEIMARVYPPYGGKKVVSKLTFKKAISDAKISLANHLNAELVDRLSVLMSNSNRESARASLERLLTETAKYHGWTALRPIGDTAKDTIDTRNTLVHMGAKTFGPLNKASLAANHLGVELQFWGILHILMRAGVKTNPTQLHKAAVNKNGGYAAYLWAKSKKEKASKGPA